MRLHNDVDAHLTYVRISKETFDILLSKVQPYLTKGLASTTRRSYVSAAERLAITLRFLLQEIHKFQFHLALE